MLLSGSFEVVSWDEFDILHRSVFAAATPRAL
jgi:hypothetical protein